MGLRIYRSSKPLKSSIEGVLYMECPNDGQALSNLRPALIDNLMARSLHAL